MLTETELQAAEALLGGTSRILWLTGAGISAESGIPTFRGKEGYWTVGSQHYRPEELATFAAFLEMPTDVWEWYLYRRSVCRKAQPNEAHQALSNFMASSDCLLLTQNVDGLHLRAGTPRERCYEIHGNIDYMRCLGECGAGPMPVPIDAFVDWEKGSSLAGFRQQALRCTCGAATRPHVLWFDESYDEEHYRFESALAAIQSYDALVVVGTSGATNLPNMVVEGMLLRDAPVVVVNRDSSPFSKMAQAHNKGLFLQGKAGTWIPKICQRLMR